MGTDLQVARLVATLEEAKAEARVDIEEAKPLRERNMVHVAFIDLRKAYDSVNRDKLLAALMAEEFPRDAVTSLARLLSHTHLLLADEGDGATRLRASRGVMQGSCCSPLLFNLYVNHLLVKLKAVATRVLAFADDLVLVARSREHME